MTLFVIPPSFVDIVSIQTEVIGIYQKLNVVTAAILNL